VNKILFLSKQLPYIGFDTDLELS